MMEEYNINWNEIRKMLTDKKVKKILIQLPEGLKQYYSYITDQLQGFELVFSGDPCFGACDIPDNRYGCDMILHFGHSIIPNLKLNVPVYFVEMRVKMDIEWIKDQLNKINCKKIGLTATLQYIDMLPEISEFLSKKHIDSYIGDSDPRITYNGQVLGCNFSSVRSIAKKVDCYIILSNGDFHAIGIEMVTGKKVYIIDPLMREIRTVTEKVDKIIRQRYAAIGMVKNASTFALIVSTKAGQFRGKYAEHIKKVLEEQGKKAYIVYLNLLDPNQMLNYNVDAFVSFACPRIAIDDWNRFNKPIITPIELEIAIGIRDISLLKFDEIVNTD
ncbi:MAG: diphthamide biosynthesis enzyme Dph2 [Thermoplasmata archaeon]